MALVLREAELNRRESTLRRAEEARAEGEGSLARASSALEAELEERLLEVERRERELDKAVGTARGTRACARARGDGAGLGRRLVVEAGRRTARSRLDSTPSGRLYTSGRTGR